MAFDVRNAFNSLRWDVIHKELENRNAFCYLKKIMKGDRSDRWVRLHLSEGFIEHRMEVRVPQGSVIGPTLWNLVYNRLLERPVGPVCEVIGYADDIALLVSGYRMDVFTDRLKHEVAGIKRWLSGVGLQLAKDKTVLTFLNSKRVPQDFSVRGPGYEICPSEEVKYLGITIDKRRTFRKHIKNITAKATRIIAALSRALPNIGGQSGHSRRFYYLIVESVVLYGASLWVEKATDGENAAALRRVQKLGFTRVVRAYRMVAGSVLGVLAGYRSLQLVVGEREKLFEFIGDEASDTDANEPEIGEYKERLRGEKRGSVKKRSGHRARSGRPLEMKLTRRGYGSLR